MADETAQPGDAPLLVLDPVEVIGSALAKARESILADAQLIQVLADHLVVLDASNSAVEITAHAIEALAESRAKTPIPGSD